MVKLSELRGAEEIHEQDMRDLDYRRGHERTRLANDVAAFLRQLRAAVYWRPEMAGDTGD
jgi:hypothetical protein